MSTWYARNGVPSPASAVSRGLERGRSLPSFFVVGPPRTGTTWLHEVLRGRAVLPQPTKETRFFDTHFERGVPWYQSHFQVTSTNQCVGEIAPTYFASSEARQRIATLIPDAKVVCIFRNPVERALSLYRVKRAYGWIPWTFEEALQHDRELLESGKYATYLLAWQNRLGAERVLATIYDDLCERPQEFMSTLADFVGLPRFDLRTDEVTRMHASEALTAPRQYHRTHYATKMAGWLKARRLDNVVSAVKGSPLIKLFLGGGPAFSELSSELTNYVYEQFRPEVEQLERILNRDFPAWRPRRPMLSLPAECGPVSTP